MKISVLGLGIIGQVWARNLMADGVSVTGWNRTPKDFPGAVLAADDAIEGADFIFIVVADPPAVSQVLDHIAPRLVPGQTVIQSSTISAQWTLRFAERVMETGARFLEAPFTGSKPAAEKRQTVFYVGGDSDLLEAATPVLKPLSKAILHIGPLGSASTIKLAMNMNIAMVMQALSESLAFARQQGIPDDTYFNALSLNVSKSGLVDLKEPVLRKGDFSPQFSLKHMHKDLGLAIADAENFELPQLKNLKAIYQRGMDAGYGDEDFSVLMRLLEKSPLS